MATGRTHRKGARRLASLVALVAALLPLPAPSSWTVEVPATLHARVPLEPPAAPSGLQAASAPGAARTGLPFAATHLGFDWRGSEDGPEVRLSPDGSTWSEWETVAADEDLSDHDEGLWFSSLIPGQEARHVEVRRAGGGRANVTAINVRDGPRRETTVRREASGATPQPDVVSRAEWGADESLRKDAPRFARIRRLFVHHTVTVNGDPDPRGTIRAIYAYHTQSRGWDDIGYNFLVDSSGRIYEGRYARAYDAGEEPTGEDRNGMGVIGAHVAGHNTGSAGVALLGDFTSAAPTSAALSGLVGLLAWKADRHGIDPAGTGADLIPAIAGHRDAGTTACPGGRLYDRLPQVRLDVETRIRAMSGLTAPDMPAGTELRPAKATRDLTPEAEGAVSRSAVRVVLSFDAEGTAHDRTFTLTPSGGSYALHDTDYGGVGLHPDRYDVRATAFDAAGRASPTAVAASGYLVTLGDVPTGYWLLGADGGVFSYGRAEFWGSTGGMRLNSSAVGMDATADGGGYWLVAADGGVFSFGNAPFHGSTGGIRLNRPIVDMAANPAGGGYWMVASDGGIFAFGGAPFHGSTGGMRLNSPIVGMAPTPTGGGYWLVASDGGVFAFGDAAFHGSTGGMRLNKPVVGIWPTPAGAGYRLVGGDGGIFTFGDATLHGSVPGRGIDTTVVRMAGTATGGGYYALSRGGMVYAFGDAPDFGNASGLRITAIDMALVR